MWLLYAGQNCIKVSLHKLVGKNCAEADVLVEVQQLVVLFLASTLTSSQNILMWGFASCTGCQSHQFVLETYQIIRKVYPENSDCQVVYYQCSSTTLTFLEGWVSNGALDLSFGFASGCTGTKSRWLPGWDFLKQ